MGDWFLDYLPIHLLPDLSIVKWVEVREGTLERFTVDTVRVVCNWFGGS
jgi:hypothetical protein